MDSRREKAVDFASETSKLLITLGTGFIAFTVTFTEKLGGALVQRDAGTWLLILSWVAFSASIGCGVWTHLALTQELEPKPGSEELSRPPSIRARSVKAGFRWQILLFCLAALLASAFGAWRMLHPVDTQQPPEIIIRGMRSDIGLQPTATRRYEVAAAEMQTLA